MNHVNQISFKRIVRVILTLLMISLLFINYAEVYNPIDGCHDNECWDKIRILDDEILMMMYLPYFALCGFYLWIKRIFIIRTLIIVLSVLYIFNCIISVSFPIQDFSPLLGVFLIFVVHVLILLLLMFETRFKKYFQ
jgi:hypothetical protein